VSKDYWQGVLETCEYFRDELGIEDAMDTNMAKFAQTELAMIELRGVKEYS
jgi:hypothetical protein